MAEAKTLEIWPACPHCNLNSGVAKGKHGTDWYAHCCKVGFNDSSKEERMSAVGFQKAQRKQAKLRLGITGPSGAGKTYTALEIATGIGGIIGVVDTENKSASLYADRFDFIVMELEPPYSADKFIKAIEDAGEAGVDVLILDSITHEWAGEGGILDTKNKIDALGRGNSYTNWAKVGPDHDRFIAAMLNAKMHLIATMRSKMEYSQEEENGKKTVKKLGMAPIQREGAEYEMTTVFDLALNHMATVSKDRTGLYDGKIFKPSRKTGKELVDWLNSGAAPKSPVQAEPPPVAQDGSSSRQSPPAESAAQPPHADKPAMPEDPEQGERGITLEQWMDATQGLRDSQDNDDLKARYLKVVQAHENTWTDAQFKTIKAYTTSLKKFHGGK